MAISSEESLDTAGNRTIEKPWRYGLRSSKGFVVAVVSIAIFTVSDHMDIHHVKYETRENREESGRTVPDIRTQDIFLYGMVGSPSTARKAP
jgi:hypothetical protein